MAKNKKAFVRAPLGYQPEPCPGCGKLPAVETSHEVLGGFIDCIAVRVLCKNSACFQQPATKQFGGEVGEGVEQKMEKMALFEWNTVTSQQPGGQSA